MAGWGQALPLFLHGPAVINCARAGASSTSFVQRGRLGWILEQITPGDLLLISFGLNDMKPGEDVFAAPFERFQANLRHYVNEARDRGAHPVLVTPHERRVFDRFGNMRRPLHLYPAAMREVAVRLSVPLIDLNEWSVAWWRQSKPGRHQGGIPPPGTGGAPQLPRGRGRQHPPAGQPARSSVPASSRTRCGRGSCSPAACFRNVETALDPARALEFPDDAAFAYLTKTRTTGGRR